ncbi:HNH endonuclease signature motif containing protein [Hydrogenophaga sp.]|uniref:HNH endonuclease n=1 Tax=Hydrogenophaga sp. TaxID=1904254 RepID=UPI002D0C5AC7|nr:HNH endonuclease signature motif containing protein [Hydrogenophaga sp.]HMP11481.1 HNH endonuclease signature motif containing protein [Hydrogenophaga sp.]
MSKSLFLNGVYDATLDEIVKAQIKHPGATCYLQPYKGEKMRLLAEEAPSPAHPIVFYASLTDSLGQVHYKGEIVGWTDKRELKNDPKKLQLLDEHISNFQPSEGKVHLTTADGKSHVNLLAVRNVSRFETPVPVSCFIKVADGKPLKKRTRAGGWSPVVQQLDWVGTTDQAVKDDIDSSLANAVTDALAASSEARKARLATANKVPEAVQVLSRAFRRNADVIAEVLVRANGICESCHSPAPFLRAADNTPYLEVHHRITLASGGEDTVENAVALCPNCHRRQHFGLAGGSGET